MTVTSLVLVCIGITINAITFMLGLIVGTSMKIRQTKV